MDRPPGQGGRHGGHHGDLGHTRLLPGRAGLRARARRRGRGRGRGAVRGVGHRRAALVPFSCWTLARSRSWRGRRRRTTSRSGSTGSTSRERASPRAAGGRLTGLLVGVGRRLLPRGRDTAGMEGTSQRDAPGTGRGACRRVQARTTRATVVANLGGAAATLTLGILAPLPVAYEDDLTLAIVNIATFAIFMPAALYLGVAWGPSERLAAAALAGRGEARHRSGARDGPAPAAPGRRDSGCGLGAWAAVFGAVNAPLSTEIAAGAAVTVLLGRRHELCGRVPTRGADHPAGRGPRACGRPAAPHGRAGHRRPPDDDLAAR